MELTISLNPQSNLPLHQQLYEELRRSILTGRLMPGQRLPSSRSIAQSLCISRTTVTQSYDRLLSEGYLESRHGSGTYVCPQLPDDLLCARQIEPVPVASPPPIKLSRYGEYLSRQPLALQPEPTAEISFRYGRPAFERIPIDLWRKLLMRHSRTDRTWLNYATDFQGYYPLRQTIAQYLARVRAVSCTPEQIVMTNGTQQALDLILRIFLEPGDRMAIEDPGYLSARRVFLSHRARLVPIPVDRAGLQVDRLVQTADSVRLVYITPSHQFPTGAILSLARRLELLDWAQQTGTLLIEDDYDSEYRYGDRPIPALQGLDVSGSVLYVGTFSKVLFPGLRIGYLVTPPQFAPLIAHAKWLSDRQLPMLEQQALNDFILEGHLESHIRKMRTHYDRRRQVLANTLQNCFGDRVTILGEQGGIHVMVQFDLDLSERTIQERAAAVGVGLMSAAPHYLSYSDRLNWDRKEFILGYGELDEAAIELGIRRLAKTLLA